MTTPVIEARDLGVDYRLPRGFRDLLRHPWRPRSVVSALRGVNLEIRASEVLALIGPNGAGKTTFMKILANLVLPTAGEVRVDGLDLRRHPHTVRRGIGYVPSDERSFFWRLSGLDNLRFFATLSEIPPRVAAERIDFYLDFFAVRDLAGRRFALFSSGQKKVFAIIRGLLQERPLTVLDEPTNSLDPPTARKLIDHVRRDVVQQHGRTVVWATHRLEEVGDVADRVALIDRGEIRFLGAAAEFEQMATRHAGKDERGDLFQVFERLVSE